MSKTKEPRAKKVAFTPADLPALDEVSAKDEQEKTESRVKGQGTRDKRQEESGEAGALDSRLSTLDSSDSPLSAASVDSCSENLTPDACGLKPEKHDYRRREVTVTIRLVDPPEKAYQARHIEVGRLSPEERRVLKGLVLCCDADNARLADGKHVGNSGAKALRYLLQKIAAADRLQASGARPEDEGE